MKLIYVLIVGLLFSIGHIYAQNDLPDAKVGQVYGTAFKVKKVKEASIIPNKVKGKRKKRMQIEGVVTDVCEKKGCWVNVKISEDKSLFVKMKDYSFFVPMNLVGKKVLLNGLAYKELTSVEELRHYAEDAKKSKAEIDAITKPKENYRFTASGIKVMD